MTPQEQFESALCHITTEGAEYNPAEAVRLIKMSSDQGYTPATSMLGAFHLMGLFVQTDTETARQLLLKAAKEGSIDAQYNLGWYYDHIERDYSKSLYRYRIAANAGHVGAKDRFASTMRYPCHVQVAPGRYNTSPSKSIYEMLRQAPDADPKDLCDLGYAYLVGESCPEDPQIGIPLLKAAAHAGNGRAQHLLGIAYENGFGIPKDKEKSLTCFSQAFWNEYVPTQERLLGSLFSYPEAKEFRSKRGFNIYKINENTHTRYDTEGFDFFGFDQRGFDRDGIHRLTQRPYNLRGFDRNGIHRKTGTEYDKEGLDWRGFDKGGKCLLAEPNRFKGYDRWGYDAEGFDKFGIGPDGYSKTGFDHWGIHRDTGTRFDPNGYDAKGLSEEDYAEKRRIESERLAAEENERKEKRAKDENWAHSITLSAEAYVKKTGRPAFSFDLQPEDNLEEMYPEVSQAAKDNSLRSNKGLVRQLLSEIPGMADRTFDFGLVADLVALQVEAATFIHERGRAASFREIVLFPSGDILSAKRVEQLVRWTVPTIFDHATAAAQLDFPITVSEETKSGDRLLEYTFDGLSSIRSSSVVIRYITKDLHSTRKKPGVGFIGVALTSHPNLPGKLDGMNKKKYDAWYAAMRKMKEQYLSTVVLDSMSFHLGMKGDLRKTAMEQVLGFKDRLDHQENAFIPAGGGNMVLASKFDYAFFILGPWVEYNLLKKDFTLLLTQKDQEFRFRPLRLVNAERDSYLRIQGVLLNLKSNTFREIQLKWRIGSSKFRDGNTFYTLRADPTSQSKAKQLAEICALLYQAKEKHLDPYCPSRVLLSTMFLLN